MQQRANNKAEPMPAELVQLLLSLAAVIILVVIVRAMRLGTSPVLRGPDDARCAAALVADSFDAANIAVDQDGLAALLADGQGRVLLLRAHGAHVAGRFLDGCASARLEGERLVVDPADRRFGPVHLHLAEPERWKKLVDAL